jgi:D-glycero-alpha-D-manno-heptose-7-phosphate kinase
MLIVRSPVRISFGGGGTDLPAYFESFGGAVLSTAINKYFYTVLTKRADNKIQVISSDLRAIETFDDIGRLQVTGSELEIPLAVIREFNVRFSANLFMASEIPPGTGLGSSGCVCVNVLKALSEYLRVPLSKYELAERAYHVSRHILQKPVGKQDEYASAFGGLNYITFHLDGAVTVDPIPLSAELMHQFQTRLMLFFTGASHNSWTILQEQEQSTKKSTSLTVESLHEISRLAAKMKDSLLRGDLDQFGRLLDESWQAKKRVSAKISNSRIDYLYEIARKSGALGGKITGAGGGGFLLLYCPPEYQPAVCEAFASEGLREMTFEFDSQGAHVVVNDPFLDGDPNCGLRWTFVPAATTY